MHCFVTKSFQKIPIRLKIGFGLIVSQFSPTAQISEQVLLMIIHRSVLLFLKVWTVKTVQVIWCVNWVSTNCFWQHYISCAFQIRIPRKILRPSAFDDICFLTLFLPAVVTWHSYMGWFRPWPVGIGLTPVAWFKLVDWPFGQWSMQHTYT